MNLHLRKQLLDAYPDVPLSCILGMFLDAIHFRSEGYANVSTTRPCFTNTSLHSESQERWWLERGDMNAVRGISLLPSLMKEAVGAVQTAYLIASC